MRTPMFSILMVSLNPGGKLVETMRSVIKQSYTDYEVVVKMGFPGTGLWRRCGPTWTGRGARTGCGFLSSRTPVSMTE